MAPIIITHDMGGPVAGRYYEVQDQIASGQHIVIDGQCFSACALEIAVPQGQICATKRAVIGVHRASTEKGTQFMMNMYPAAFRQWIESRGGLKSNMMYISGRALAKFIPPCPGNATQH